MIMEKYNKFFLKKKNSVYPLWMVDVYFVTSLPLLQGATTVMGYVVGGRELMVTGIFGGVRTASTRICQDGWGNGGKCITWRHCCTV